MEDSGGETSQGEAEDEEEGAEDGDEEDAMKGVEKETPGQGLRKRKAADEEPSSKKARLAEPQAEGKAVAPKPSARQERKLLNKQKKAERKADKKKTQAEKPASQAKQTVGDDDEKTSQNGDTSQLDAVVQSKEEDDEEDGKGQSHKTKDMQPIDVSGLADDDDDASRSSQSSNPESSTFDPPADNLTAEPASTTTSIASETAGAGPAATAERPGSSSKKLKVPSDTTELRARLAAKIAALRAARKADGPDGTPIRTRQELIESRRKKQAEKTAHKKELRQKAKAAEDAKREEALASARNSPMLSFGSGSPEHEAATSFSFGRVTFADGTHMSQDLSYVKDRVGRKKGPTDPKGALAKLEAQKKRLAGLDADKRKEVLEKETWLAARKRAEGEKVHKDESLLKKAVKRKDKTKKKSEKEWNDRLEGVKYAQKQKQQKREDNIRKRKEAKQAGKGGKKKGKSPVKKKSRPGFEGSGFGGRRK